MVLEALREDRLDTSSHLRDQHCIRGVGRGRLERVPDRDDPAVNHLHQVDKQAEQRRDGDFLGKDERRDAVGGGMVGGMLGGLLDR